MEHHASRFGWIVLGYLVICASGCKRDLPTTVPSASKVYSTAPETSSSVPPDKRASLGPESAPSPEVSVHSRDEQGTPGQADTTVLAGPKIAQFYGVYIKGQKAGWAEQRVTTLARGGTELWMRVVVRLARGSERTGLELIHTNRYAAGNDGGLQEVQLVQMLPNGGKAVYSGRYRDDRFVMTVTSGEKTTSTVVPAPKERAFDSVGHLLAKRLLKLGKGKSVLTYQFDPMTMKSVPIQTTLTRKSTRFASGAEFTVLDIQGVDKVRGLNLETRLTSTGQALEMVIGPGFRLVLEDKQLAQDQSQGAPDLYRLSRVPVDKPLGSAMTITGLRLELSGLSPNIQLSDNRQKHNARVLEVQVHEIETLEPEDLVQSEKARWLSITPFLDHDSSIFETILRAVQSREPVDRVRALSRAVHNAIQYTLATAPLSASEILRQGTGDCTEYSRALTAVLRADGIPAREVSGMAYAGDEFGFAFHAWVEAYINGRWVAIDPTWDQYPVDATHIAISRDDPSPIIGLLGGLSVKVLAVERK